MSAGLGTRLANGLSSTSARTVLAALVDDSWSAALLAAKYGLAKPIRIVIRSEEAGNQAPWLWL